jgi:hypothetical protein
MHMWNYHNKIPLYDNSKIKLKWKKCEDCHGEFAPLREFLNHRHSVLGKGCPICLLMNSVMTWRNRASAPLSSLCCKLAMKTTKSDSVG